MKHITLIILIISLSGLYSSFVSNACADCYGNACIGKVTTLYPHSGNMIVYIGTDGDERGLPCTPYADTYITLLPAQPLFKEIYSLLLEGMMNDRTMSVRIDNNVTECRVLYVTTID